LGVALGSRALADNEDDAIWNSGGWWRVSRLRGSYQANREFGVEVSFAHRRLCRSHARDVLGFLEEQRRGYEITVCFRAGRGDCCKVGLGVRGVGGREENDLISIELSISSVGYQFPLHGISRVHRRVMHRIPGLHIDVNKGVG